MSGIKISGKEGKRLNLRGLKIVPGQKKIRNKFQPTNITPKKKKRKK